MASMIMMRLSIPASVAISVPNSLTLDNDLMLGDRAGAIVTVFPPST
jgi:hypothetical protein